VLPDSNGTSRVALPKLSAYEANSCTVTMDTCASLEWS
jgi:hypothetical protein